MFEQLERNLRRTGSDSDASIADAVEALCRLRGKDIHASIEEVLPVRKFGTEAREALIEKGFVIHSLNGKSLRDIADEGRPVHPRWFLYPEYDISEERSMRSEVAIDTDDHRFFLSGSGNKDYPTQKELLKAYSEGLASELTGTKAIIGNAADYLNLIFTHQDTTGEKLFGYVYGLNSTRTSTMLSVNGSVRHITVGAYTSEGVKIDNLDEKFRGHYTFIAPLIVPA